jgi:hypothetical protein
MSPHTRKGRTTIGVSLLVTLAMTAMLLIYGGSSASSATSRQATARTATFTRVAHDAQGYAKSKIVGTTTKGRRVTGYFVPFGFSKHNGHLRARGLISGVVHKGDGTTRTFDVVRTLRVKSMNGTVPGTTARGAAVGGAGAGSCDILHLVLAPLDLDLLGLQVHLDRVVLDIVAQSGAGQLLGNLLCAVAGLLDNGGTLSQLLNRLGQILDQLLMGL